MNDEYQYSKEEEGLPEFSGKGKVVPVYFEYLAEAKVGSQSQLQEWLTRKVVEGWRLVSVDGGIHYFQREKFLLYEDIGGDLVRIKPGRNS